MQENRNICCLEMLSSRGGRAFSNEFALQMWGSGWECCCGPVSFQGLELGLGEKSSSWQRALSCRHFAKSIPEGPVSKSAPTPVPVAHSVSSGVGCETDQASRLSFPATEGLFAYHSLLSLALLSQQEEQALPLAINTKHFHSFWEIVNSRIPPPAPCHTVSAKDALPLSLPPHWTSSRLFSLCQPQKPIFVACSLLLPCSVLAAAVPPPSRV